ncbi:MAG: glycolate oxidase subunit GlcE, partial [Gammaproteobacteria bacterium]|nr:glycolate oxidase subunit GlcE [Gammaproteobacteria bacterium]
MDISKQLQQTIADAFHHRQPLQIIGNNTRAFYGRNTRSENAKELHVTDHNGILDYQPTELTITARAGTPVKEIVDVLAGHKQMLAFEPPGFDNRATFGGCIATALAGPRRPWTGSVRDYVIGTRILTGDARVIRLGGKVMKNVAGYDLFRPMAGSLGTLGVMLDITVKLLPLPEQEISFIISTDQENMHSLLQQWRRSSLPLSAASFYQGQLSIRLSGSASAIDDAINKLPADRKEIANNYWQILNEQQLEFFDDDTPLYRLVVPANAAYGTFNGECLADWGGALRWVKTPLSFDQVQ